MPDMKSKNAPISISEDFFRNMPDPIFPDSISEDFFKNAPDPLYWNEGTSLYWESKLS